MNTLKNTIFAILALLLSINLNGQNSLIKRTYEFNSKQFIFTDIIDVEINYLAIGQLSGQKNLSLVSIDRNFDTIFHSIIPSRYDTLTPVKILPLSNNLCVISNSDIQGSILFEIDNTGDTIKTVKYDSIIIQNASIHNDTIFGYGIEKGSYENILFSLNSSLEVIKQYKIPAELGIKSVKTLYINDSLCHFGCERTNPQGFKLIKTNYNLDTLWTRYINPPLSGGGYVFDLTVDSNNNIYTISNTGSDGVVYALIDAYGTVVFDTTIDGVSDMIAQLNNGIITSGLTGYDDRVFIKTFDFDYNLVSHNEINISKSAKVDNLKKDIEGNYIITTGESLIKVYVLAGGGSIYFRQFLCGSDSVSIEGKYNYIGNNALSFRWSDLEGKNLGESNELNYKINYPFTDTKLIFDCTDGYYHIVDTALLSFKPSIIDIEQDSLQTFCGDTVKVNHYINAYMLNGLPVIEPNINIIQISGAWSEFFPNQTTVYTITINPAEPSCESPSDSIKIIVSPKDYNLSFDVESNHISTPPFAFQFNNMTVNKSDLLFTWDFGDGNTKESNNDIVFHEYEYNGEYDIKLKAINITSGCVDSLVKTDYVYCTGGSDAPTSLSTIEMSSIYVFPTNFNDKITIRPHGHSINISVYSSDLRKVYTSSVIRNIEHTIYTSNWNEGLYFLTYELNAKKYVHKIIKTISH
jgi:hypothetical protein